MLLDIIQFLREIDQVIFYYIKELGLYIYVLLFAVVFSKTAFVILTFLPGDSTVFTSGTLAAIGKLDLITLLIIFIVATTLADSNNYLIGKIVRTIPERRNLFMRFISEETNEKALKFLEEYDRVAITFSRFVPLMRTMTPFICGYTGLSYSTFLRYNFIGATLWTVVWLGGGFLLGNIPWVEDNIVLTLAIISIIVFGFAGFAYLKQFKKKKTIPLK
ncbi:VTT domain-containing protein [Solibacillus sp. A46]|uniref:VTT domain-containing protein n=1 Tax=Solibacillus faecavium TaxID=2762221 RepID=A0ABR8XYP2_9BACL|nr:VTT domain-containing protein [Solibacillus faecavium]MBD8036954.1 VTT domain-containing protein [Solibacillus faecavium]